MAHGDGGRLSSGAWTMGLAVVVTLALTVLGLAQPASAAICGGAVTCQCGDTVGSNYTMTADLGPCPRLPGDTVGLRVRSGVTLDCADHAIIGPGDLQKDSFGIRVGTDSAVSNATVRRCQVSRFWWGVHVDSAVSNVLIEDNVLHDNGWFVPEENGSGYGIDVANSTGVTVRGNIVRDNGNEGLHLSASSGVVVEDNEFHDNGREQVYLINADDNIIRRNLATGGTQGLEMRVSSRNAFSYNRWLGSPLQYLENDNADNTFLYERFEGRVAVGANSTGNRFDVSTFTNPAGNCLTVTAPSGAYVFKGIFSACNFDVVGNALVTLDRSVNNLAKITKTITVKFPGCTADMDLDGNVTAQDLAAVQTAQSASPASPAWDPEADLDRNGRIDAADVAITTSQSGPCAADLAIGAVSNPPSGVVPGGTFQVTDTVVNQSGIASGTSRTQYYLSADTVKNAGDKLLGGRSVPALPGNGTSAGAAVTVVVPTTTALGSYYLVACADDTGLLSESDESDNCRASTTQVQIGRPDLVLTALGNPPATAGIGTAIAVSDTVKNQSVFPAGASRVQYYLSLDQVKDTSDKLLTGGRSVGALAAGLTSAGGVSVTVPTNTTAGTYYLIGCADDARVVIESNETNNCRASGQIEVGRPDLVVTAVSEPPGAIVRGKTFSVTDTTRNATVFAATSSRVQYYLSTDGAKNVGDRLLTGFRTIASLAGNATSTGTITVTVPAATTAGTYFLLACADDAVQVVEGIETNNCRASVGRVTVSVGP